MKILTTPLEGVLVIEPQVFHDKRGFFTEIYHKDKYHQIGIEDNFVQDNLSLSTGGSLRGLHFQFPHEQAKLVQVIKGEVFDVAVDIRYGSPTFGQWTGISLSDKNKKQLYIPKGFAHGFCVLSEKAAFVYKCSDFYAPECEGGILWCDTDLDIKWPLKNPVLSDRDGNLPYLNNIPIERLPRF